MRIARTLAALATAGAVTLGGLVAPGAPPAAAATKDHDVVFLVDGSGSIDAADWTIQLQGFAAALQDRVNFPIDGSMSVSVIQWAADTPRVEIPLTNLDSKAALESVVASVSTIRQMNSGTNPGDGIRAGVNELALNGRAGAQRTLCMSTDGERNGGEALTSATAYAKAKGVNKYTVVAIEDGSFKAANATRAYGPYVFGGGTVTTARTTAEFTGLISGCVAESSALEALEVTQSIQDLENSIPLIAGKDTIVRAYLTKTGGAQGTSGRLRGYRGGVELPGSPLSPINSPTRVVVDAAYLGDRASMSRTLNFELPFGWQSGSVELSLELPGGVTCSEPGTGDFPCAETVTFGGGMDYLVNYTAFAWKVGDVTTRTTQTQLYDQQVRAAVQLPAGASDTEVTYSEILRTKPIKSISEANAAMSLADVAGNPFNLDYNVMERWYGVIPGHHPERTEGGRADGVNASSWLEDDGTKTFAGRSRNRAAHELAHTYGRHHTTNSDENGFDRGGQAGWCKEVSSKSAPDWPYWHATTDRDGNGVVRPTMSALGKPRLQVWGIDTSNIQNADLALSDPGVVHPLMSYCDSNDERGQQRWITAEDYKHLLSGDIAPLGSGASERESNEPSSALVLRGSVDLDTSVVELEPALAFNAALTGSDPSGTHDIAVFDDNGVELYSMKFTPTVADGDPAEGSTSDGSQSAPIFGVIPADLVGAKSVQVRVGGTVLWSQDMSVSTPTASIDAPSTGTADDLHVTWSSQDEDSDELTHTLLYSADSGTTWKLVATDLTGASADLARWPLAASSHARLKVIVSDGLRSSEAISEEFTLPNLAPNVTITDPLDGTTVSGSQTFAMDAQIYDAEDGALDGASVVWTSDRNGNLGTGSRLLKRADELAEGTHVITVTVTDSAGAKTSRSITAHVNRIDEVPADPSTCSVDYVVHGTSPGAFTAQVTLSNTGPDAIDGWSLAWVPAAGEAVTHFWSSDITTGPGGVAATSLSWNKMIAPGGTVTFGFNGSTAGAATPVVPAEFLLNGGPCL